eukprot:4432959-Lingulodinium_polyedra.AAC.1
MACFIVLPVFSVPVCAHVRCLEALTLRLEMLSHSMPQMKMSAGTTGLYMPEQMSMPPPARRSPMSLYSDPGCQCASMKSCLYLSFSQLHTWLRLMKVLYARRQAAARMSKECMITSVPEQPVP